MSSTLFDLAFDATDARRLATFWSDHAAELTRLRRLDARVLGEVDTGSARWITLVDPDGNAFDLIDGS